MKKIRHCRVEIAEIHWPAKEEGTKMRLLRASTLVERDRCTREVCLGELLDAPMDFYEGNNFSWLDQMLRRATKAIGDCVVLLLLSVGDDPRDVKAKYYCDGRAYDDVNVEVVVPSFNADFLDKG